MKNGKKPTLRQKVMMKEKGLMPEKWLVVKDTTEYMEVVSKDMLKKVSGRVHTKKLYKDI